MEELSITWEQFTHPDMEAIRRRDEFLNSAMCENIEFIDGEIHADFNMPVWSNGYDKRLLIS